MIKKEAEKILKGKILPEKYSDVQCKNKSDTINNVGDWNQLKIIQKNNSATYRVSTK